MTSVVYKPVDVLMKQQIEEGILTIFIIFHTSILIFQESENMIEEN